MRLPYPVPVNGSLDSDGSLSDVLLFTSFLMVSSLHFHLYGDSQPQLTHSSSMVQVNLDAYRMAHATPLNALFSIPMNSH